MQILKLWMALFRHVFLYITICDSLTMDIMYPKDLLTKRTVMEL